MSKHLKPLYAFCIVLLSVMLFSGSTFSQTVYLTGPSYIESGSTGTYVASVLGGMPPYTYAWAYYVICDEESSSLQSDEGNTIQPMNVPCGSWIDFGGTTNIATKSADAEGRVFQVRCTVTDVYGSSGSASKTVYPLAPPSVTVTGPTYLASGATGTYTATVSNGLSPYTYAWSYYVICASSSSLASEGESEIQPFEVPCASWINLSSTTTTATKAADGVGRSFTIKCAATDSYGRTGSGTLTVEGYAELDPLAEDNSAFEMAAEKSTEQVTETTLSNYPNPFNPTTTIAFSLPESGFISLKVYDVVGREVAVLANSVHTAGNYNYKFNAGSLASGTYIYRLVTPSKTITQKMLLVK